MRRLSLPLLASIAVAPLAAQRAIHPVAAVTAPTPAEWRPLLYAIGDRRIVLLGENGHGVAEYTRLKVSLVQALAMRGFDLVIFESGFAECAQAAALAADRPAGATLRACLGYAFEHAEALPLFERFRTAAVTNPPLHFAGMDPQVQGNDALGRWTLFGRPLRAVDAALAARVVADDSTLVARTLLGRDSLLAWIGTEGEAARRRALQGAALVRGAPRLALRLDAAMLERLTLQREATLAGQELPQRAYALRDEWMARAVAFLADSMGTRRKVIVWLHDDHARADSLTTPAGPTLSTGGWLARWYPGETFALGFLMGEGKVADNSRRERDVPATPPDGLERFFGDLTSEAGYVVLRGATDPALRRWSAMEAPFVRAGLSIGRLTPARAFDAMLFVRRVTPATYRLP